MDLKNCECGCGSPVTPRKRFVSGHNGRGRRKAPMVHKCEQCGVNFETRPHIKIRKYCSNSCRDLFRKERTGSNHPLYKRSEHPCGVCGKPVMVTPAMLKNKRLCFCSKQCSKESHRIALTGRPKANVPRSGKMSARVRDGGKCVICGFGHVTAVHHVIPRKEGGSNALENLVTLCPNHHYMAHAGLIPVEEMARHAKPFSFYDGIPVITKNLRTNVSFRS